VLPDIFPHDRPGDGGLAVPVMTIGHKPASESEIKREMERQAGQRR